MKDHDVQETWEGDNHVLIQQSSKYVLDQARLLFRGKPLTSPFCEPWLTIMPVADERFPEDGLSNNQHLVTALQHRINASVQEIGMDLQTLLGDGMDALDAWNALQPNGINLLGRHYAELYTATEFLNRINNIKEDDH